MSKQLTIGRSPSGKYWTIYLNGRAVYQNTTKAACMEQWNDWVAVAKKLGV